ncbi:hypothetical protein LSTR_LSTR012070 [Laodelphax striatellus]|uniref:Membrane metallo-endopeptidase-like 1 n=1 Tax=Laodelphax striatellus TaxID=195883 RepID=A0A482WR88_LAOST|nr:hypothetical protein LSTR_LSTR012070 [Laodelphax striatellus]
MGEHAGKRIDVPNICCDFGSGTTSSRIQCIISALSLAFLFLSLIDGVESASHGCRYRQSKQHQQKQNFDMPSIATFSWKNERESASIQGPGRQKQDWNLCLTAGCVMSANSVLQNMDRKINPCDNFFEFACGKFLKETRVADDKTGVTAFSLISDKLEEQLRDVLDRPVSPNDIKPFVYTKHLFNACMNKALIEEKGAAPVLSLLKELGGWPVLEGSNWNEAEWDWKKSVYTNRKKGFSYSYFLSFAVRPDMKNSKNRVIILDQASLGMGQEYLIKGLKDKLVAAYYNYMVDIAVLFGADKKIAKTELRKSVEFEINLANISIPREERRDTNKLYNSMTLTQLQQKFSSIPWKEYFQNMLPHKIKLKPNERVIVYAPSFIKKLETLMKDTPKRVQANYALWRAAGATISYLPDNFRRRQLEYIALRFGMTEREARWKECVKVVSSSLPQAVGAQYVRKFFKEDSKENAEELVNRIRKEMYKILDDVDWMDEKTRAAALEKAKAMTTHIAYPDELLDDKKLIEFYEKLEIIGPDDYIGAELNLTKCAVEFSFNRLRDPVNKTEWISHGRPAIVNAFYNSIENSIQFPAGILQGTFFNKDRPHFMNYGAIGYVIGHEVTHAFDDEGNQFNKDGNLVDWWEEETKKKYLEKAKCIINQYGNYTSRQVDIKLNGVNTQGENIADNGGIKLSYYAYQSWEEQYGPEPRLPGLQMYSPQQMFWISAANVWCAKHKDESLKNQITTGVHSPDEFRVIGSLSNLKEFSQDFGCPTGSKMNPKHKCSVW